MHRSRMMRFRLYFLAALTLCALGTITIRLWYIQLIKGIEYRSRVNMHSKITVRIPAVRGTICDRNGIPLVRNRASFDVDFHLPTVLHAYKQIYGRPPQTTYRAIVGNMIKDLPEDDIITVVKEMIIRRLDDLWLARELNTYKLQLHYRSNIEIPFHYRQDVDFDTMARFSENNSILPGVTVNIYPVRHYVYGAMAAHILGYIGMPRDINRKEASKFSFFQPDVEGKSQIELYANDWLKGTPGMRILQRNAKGITEREVNMVTPKCGNNVCLTIDARLQYIAEKAMRAVSRGAAVIVNPNGGDILAMVSVPSFDPNKFIPAISVKDWSTLITDPTGPLINRAIGAYAPGSIYKIVTALAGLPKELGQTPFSCSGGIQYGNKYMQCWVLQKNLYPHGSLNLSDALKVSCNAFFYQYGNAAGIDQIAKIGNMLGLGLKTGIPLTGEAAGLLPTPKWLTVMHPIERWSAGYTANTSIGQGFVLTTPLQMALLIATIANGGITYYPRLIDRIVSPNGHIIFQAPAKMVRTDFQKEGIQRKDFEVVRDGLWKVINSEGGTGKRVHMQNIAVAGKSGTAQFWRDRVKDNRVWFVAFAPFKTPKYAVCVMVEGAKSGSGVAAPIVNKILRDIFSLENGGEVQLATLSPARGSFSQIESVHFDEGANIENEARDEEAASTTTLDLPDATDTKRHVVQPPRAEEANVAGRVLRCQPSRNLDAIRRDPQQSSP